MTQFSKLISLALFAMAVVCCSENLAMSYKLVDSSGAEMCAYTLPSFAELTVNVSSYQTGEYTLLCTVGKEQYV